VSNLKSQTEDEMRKIIEQQCKTMRLYFILEEELKALNVTEDCFCSVNAEVSVKMLSKIDTENMTVADMNKLMQDIFDENSTIHNEYVHNLTTMLEKKCGASLSSSVAVTGVQKGSIALTKYGAMYKIKLSIGNSSKYFTIDTGAENSFITKSYARELEDIDLIRPDNYTEPLKYQDAHGKIVLHKRVILNDVKIGDFTLNNVIFAIGNDDSGGFLFGKDILNAFKSWNINNVNSILELEK
jgi:predicted aspartyl protease